MKLSDARMQKLKLLLQDELGPVATDEDLEHAAVAIMHFVLQKQLRMINNEREHTHDN